VKLTALTVSNDYGTVSVEHGSTLDLDGSTIHGGTVSIDGTLDATGGSAITEANLEIGDHGVVESTHGGVLTIDPHGAVGITNHGTLEADGGEIDIIHEAVSNADTLQAVDGGTMKLESLTVTNTIDGEVSAELESMLDLVDAIIKGGTIHIDGTLDSTGSSAIDGAHIGIHPCRRIHEPGAKVAGGVLGIPPVSRDQPGRCQRRHLQAESNQGMAMCNEVVGIGHPVALDVGPVGMIRIGPPIVSLREVIVFATSATLGPILGDSDGTLAKIPARGTQHPAALNLDYVESVALRNGGTPTPR